ncbi:MauE/DoxX family redox-associated membrane protein [Nocardiopsis alba]|uniref:MauE/DoxX family redox-associated membrane protein n=1 Tax=Nocardiopsis alba TaxID=53437 RepID=UPI0035DACF5D
MMTEIVALAAQYALFLIFLAAWVGKIKGPGRFSGFATVISRLTGWSPPTARAVGVTVVSGEVLACLLLISPLTAVAGAVVALTLLTAFTGVAVKALWSGIRSECSCFGGSDSAIGYAMIVRNLLLIALALTPIGVRADLADLSATGVVAVALGALAIALLLIGFYDPLARRATAAIIATRRATRPRAGTAGGGDDAG